MGDSDASTPERVGRFEIRGPLGAGGMGEVFDAYDPSLERRVALKLMSVEARADASRVTRFLREAKAAAAVQHPNIVVIFEVGTSDEHGPYLAMERVEGQSLRSRLGGKPLDLDTAKSIARDVANGLAAAHGADLVHRDLKPENILITTEGVAKVLDFGLAKSVEIDAAEAHADTQEVLTAEGAILGSPGYMAPEQARGQPIDKRADVFSFGALLYEMLAGRRPFAADTPLLEIVATLGTEPDDLSTARPDAPAHLVALAHRCLSKDADRRPDDASAIRDALDAGSGETRPSRDAPLAHAETLDAAPTTVAEAISTANLPTPRKSNQAFILGAFALIVVGAGAAWAMSSNGAEHGAGAEDLPSPRGPLLIPCEGEREADECDQEMVAWCNREGERLACCGVGLVPDDLDGACGCPPGGATVEAARESGCPPPDGPGLDLHAIQSAVREARPLMQECYEDELVDNPQATGQVTLTFRISPYGDVFDAKIEGSTLPLPEVQRCVKRVMQRIQFPAPTDAEVKDVRYPFFFGTTEDDEGGDDE